MLEGGVGLGGVFAYYVAGEQFFDEFYDTDLGEGDITWSIPPFPPHRLPRRRSDGRT